MKSIIFKLPYNMPDEAVPYLSESLRAIVVSLDNYCSERRRYYKRLEEDARANGRHDEIAEGNPFKKIMKELKTLQGESNEY
jgi:hypothetical protein